VTTDGWMDGWTDNRCGHHLCKLIIHAFHKQQNTSLIYPSVYAEKEQ